MGEQLKEQCGEEVSQQLIGIRAHELIAQYITADEVEGRAFVAVCSDNWTAFKVVRDGSQVRIFV